MVARLRLGSRMGTSPPTHSLARVGSLRVPLPSRVVVSRDSSSKGNLAGARAVAGVAIGRAIRVGIETRTAATTMPQVSAGSPRPR